MSVTNPTVVVTGGNRGIGFEICRQLAKRKARVVLTARSTQSGEQALGELAAEDLPVYSHFLDVTDETSIAGLRDYVAQTFGQLDVLINNAGMISKKDAVGLEVELDTVRATLETNTLGPLRLAQVLAPLMRKGTGRIINISSGMGAMNGMGSDHAAYRISKAALNAVTGILAVDLAGSIAVNSMCPGWVKTDMGGQGAEREIPEGADTAVWLALDAPQNLTGKFLRDRQVIPW